MLSEGNMSPTSSKKTTRIDSAKRTELFQRQDELIQPIWASILRQLNKKGDKLLDFDNVLSKVNDI